MNELISIVMPAKNVAPYIRESLNSIIDQKDIDWELIVVDDNSVDDTYQILTEYALLDSRIHVLKNQGKGIIDALSFAYLHSSGTLITRMDADDKMSDDKLLLMRQAAVEAGQGIVITGLVEYFSDAPLGNGYLQYQNWLNQLTLTSDNYRDIYKECAIPSPCWMVWKSDLDKLGGFDQLVYPEDYDLAFKFYQNQLKVVGIPNTLHYWRDYPERTSRNDDNYKDNRFLEIKIRYFIEVDYHPQKTLVLWGAGKKGKKIASLLREKGVEFRWICNTPTKVGHMIHNVKLENSENFDFSNSQLIIAIAGKDDQKAINQRISPLGMEYYYFC